MTHHKHHKRTSSNTRRRRRLRNTLKLPRFIVKKRVSSRRPNTGANLFFNAPRNAALFTEGVSRLQELILIGDEVTVADPGIYTWIIKQFDGEAAPTIVAASPICNQEIGTLHANLDGMTAPGRVIIAGEFEKSAIGTITFNFESGTYSLPILRREPHREAEFIALFQSFLPTASYTPAPILSRQFIATCPAAWRNTLGPYFTGQ